MVLVLGEKAVAAEGRVNGRQVELVGAQDGLGENLGAAHDPDVGVRVQKSIYTMDQFRAVNWLSPVR